MPKFPQKIKKWLPPRKKQSHKGDFGRVCIVAGSKGMSGAACLAADGALLVGAGLVTVAIPESIHSIVASHRVEALTKPLPETSEGSLSLKAQETLLHFISGQDVLLVGPGLSQVPETQRLIRNLIAETKRPTVIDADGLNAFVGSPGALIHKDFPLILTPHPGELTRLFKMSVSARESERVAIAKRCARQFSAIIVLKGHRTVVASPQGKEFVNSTGNPGLAKGGTGDLLSGMIAGLIAQKLAPFDAAQTAVYLHGLAADLAVKQYGEISLLASNVAEFIPKALIKVRGI